MGEPDSAKTMGAWRIRGFGGPEVLSWERVPVPAPGPDEVLVRVAYCGVCRHDLLTRAGAFPKIPLPMTLGHQVSGVVVDRGERARFEVGARVLSLIFMGCGGCAACERGNQAGCLSGRALFMGDDFDGGYAEYLCVPDRAMTRIPDGIPLDLAAVTSCTLGTAYHALKARAALTAGESVVITGASGGIGLHALSVARLLGARSIAVTSREGQARVLVEHGADEVIVAPDLRFARRVKELTGGVGADAVIEIVGAATMPESLHAVRTGGRVVVLGNVDGRPSEVRPAHLIMKEMSLIGTKSCTEAELAEVFALVAAGRLTLDITGTRPLSAAADIHREMEERSVSGRIVMRVHGETAPAAGGAR
ncbi:alcohol dehydrogenase catalytic domain-containing protein [Rhizomonospora bruguierae]|uniref:alcohol dehydrogenase catalytic domain-containing protein n=1 Tax=Rhizomonospora bruguierae TaxID=1581705 RepID=UPI001BD17214|nr:alcohol dehydrogenase catalytic domain-containing protein [Micromonospora sp. NBRC 107566]